MSHDLERKLSHMLKLDKEKTLKEINEFGYAFISSANALREYIKSVNDYKLNQLSDDSDKMLVCRVILELAYNSIDEQTFLASRKGYYETINFVCNTYSLKRENALDISLHVKPLINILNKNKH
ncbi:hypothetical protein [Pseudoalteromonas sp. SIMBA_162]|uniref:hypothetical protein n=1 Tax=Pseudoalteromonas sp. SIMBA_162 TaxID=3080867 RepID=UPI00397D565C